MAMNWQENKHLIASSEFQNMVEMVLEPGHEGKYN